MEAVGRRGGNSPATGEALRAISMAEEKEGFSWSLLLLLI